MSKIFVVFDENALTICLWMEYTDSGFRSRKRSTKEDKNMTNQIGMNRKDQQKKMGMFLQPSIRKYC